MKPYTNQTAYDKAKAHLLAQNKRCVGDNGVCLYRGPNGLMCALGALIPDEAYSPKIEDIRGTTVIQRPNMRVLFEGVNPVLIDDLQDCHDEYDPEDWPDRLNEIARLHDLKQGE